MTEQPDTVPLPGVLADIEAAIGRPWALQLARKLGGAEIYLASPERIGRTSPVARAVGLDRARKLAESLGRGKLLIPLGPTSSSKQIRAAVRREIDAGLSNNAIAVKLHVHERTVRRERDRALDGRQSDLFPGAD
ncbi:MAG: helix-turn-helix domain-containing protein [Alphaproteobacteria bacterium]